MLRTRDAPLSNYILEITFAGKYQLFRSNSSEVLDLAVYDLEATNWCAALNFTCEGEADLGLAVDGQEGSV